LLLQLQGISRAEIGKPLPHFFTEICVLGFSRTVAGIVSGGQAEQLCRNGIQPCSIFCRLGIQLGKMQPANENIGAKICRQITHALVGTSADENTLPLFLNQQILFVQKIIGLQPALPHDLQTKGLHGFRKCCVIAGKKRHVRAERKGIPHGDQPVFLLQGRVQPDVAVDGVVVFSKGVAAVVDLRLGIVL